MWLVFKRKPSSLIILFIPGLIVTSIFMIYPLINGFLISLTNESPIRPLTRFIGLDNYIYLITNPNFWEIFLNNFIIIGFSILISIFFGFSISLLLNQKLRGTYFFRVSIFQIWVVPWISVAILIGWIFNSDYGVINYLFMEFGIFNDKANWFGDSILAKIVIIIGFAWRMIPFMMVVSLAAIQSIPNEIIEASKIDGASYFQRLFYIILPLLRNIIFILCLLQLVKLFQEITLPWVLTGGGPINSTTTLSLYVYKLAFINWDFGLASAAGWLWLVFLLIFSFFYFHFFNRNYNE